MVLLYQFGLFSLVNALVYVEQNRQRWMGLLCNGPFVQELGKKDQTDRAKLSEVDGSFYAMVFMVRSVCSSIDFC